MTATQGLIDSTNLELNIVQDLNSMIATMQGRRHQMASLVGGATLTAIDGYIAKLTAMRDDAQTRLETKAEDVSIS